MPDRSVHFRHLVSNSSPLGQQYDHGCLAGLLLSLNVIFNCICSVVSVISIKDCNDLKRSNDVKYMQNVL